MELTHLDQLKQMLESIGYEVFVVKVGNLKQITVSPNGKNVHGYLGFVADFEFNDDGSLNNIGIYE